MITEPTNIETVDEYIARFPEDIRAVLEKIRTTVRKAAPDAEETISYRMPAYKQDGVLVYFAAYQRHIGFYPTASGIENFKDELSTYKSARGSVRFPLDRSIPYGLIGNIVRFRVRENRAKAEEMKKKRR